MTDPDLLARWFDERRPRLVRIAARMLGSRAEAEDVVQDAWLRLQRSDVAEVVDLDAWMTTVVSRLSVDVLRSARHLREKPWVVEAWETTGPSPDPADEMVRAELVGAALVTVLEVLTPAERLAFVLHDVFGVEFAAVARMLGRSESAVRQLASRARRRVRSDPADIGAPAGESDVVGAWLRAVEHGDLAALLELLDGGAVLRADYGTHIEELRGAAEIGARATLAARLAAASTPVRIDGRPGIAAVVGGRPISLMGFTIVDGRIIALDVLLDPSRIRALPG